MKKGKYAIDGGFHALVWKEGKWFVARGVELEIASQGKTRKEAVKNLEEAVTLYFEDEKVTVPHMLQEPELVSVCYA